MLYPSLLDWEQWGITEEKHQFFFLRWHEVFEENTFDAWQVRTSNIVTIIAEMLACLEIIEKVHTFHHNLAALIDEAESNSKKDLVINSDFPFVYESLSKLRNVYNTQVRPDKYELSLFKRILHVIKGNLATYPDRILINLENIIFSQVTTSKYKIDLYSLTMSYAIHLRSLGYSVKALRESIDILKNKTVSFKDRFENLINSFSGKEREFECRFYLNWPDSKITDIRTEDIVLSSKRPVETPTKEERLFYSIDSQAVVATIKIKALDCYYARYQAEEKLERLFSMLQLYKAAEANIKHSNALIVFDNNEHKIIGPDTTRLKYIKDAKKPYEAIVRFIRLQNNLRKEDANQLTASLQYYRLFLSAHTDESRLVNLWIALEALLQEGGKNIIDRLIALVPPSDSSTYIFKIIRALPSDFHIFWKNSDTIKLQKILTKSNRYNVDLGEILSTLLDIRDGNLIESFLTFSSANPLLMFRMYRLWDKTFRSPNILASRINNHKKMLNGNFEEFIGHAILLCILAFHHLAAANLFNI
jgi:hypothetical protein